MSRRQCDQIPELGKLRHFGKKCFWKNIESYWVFGRNFELIWIKNCHSANLCRCNWPNIEQINLAIGSHWYYVGRWCTILMGLWNLMHAFTLCLFESIEPSGRINVFFCPLSSKIERWNVQRWRYLLTTFRDTRSSPFTGPVPY